MTQLPGSKRAHLIGRRQLRAWKMLALSAFLCLSVLGTKLSSAPAQTARGSDVEVVQTSSDLSQHLKRLSSLSFAHMSTQGMPVIDVNDRVRYQQIRGFGAAMTDSSAWLLHDELTTAQSAVAFADLFGRAGGIGLGFLRVPIGASDYTRNGVPYTYDDLPRGQSDPGLRHFSVRHDLAYIIPAIHQALSFDPQLEILANPWSPPAWMKANQALDNTGNAGTLLRSAYGPFARYQVKFVQSYAHLGIPVADIAPQNEPTNATSYPGLDLGPADEATFIARYLGPALHRAGLRPRIYAHDYGWSAKSTAYAEALVNRLPKNAISGLAWHCYFGNPSVMSLLHRLARGIDEMIDECSPGITPFPVTEVVVSGLRNWASVVALWNLALKPQGGPVEPPNHGCPTCTGVVTVDPQRHTVHFTTSFFQLGQASAFIQPGARRIESNHFVSYIYRGPGGNVVTPGLDDVAALNPDGTKVLIAYDNASAPIRFAVSWHGQAFSYSLAPKATVTFAWR